MIESFDLTDTTISWPDDLGVMVMKRYFTFYKAPGLEPCHQFHYSVMPGTLTCVCVGWGEVVRLSFC